MRLRDARVSSRRRARGGRDEVDALKQPGSTCGAQWPRNASALPLCASLLFYAGAPRAISEGPPLVLDTQPEAYTKQYDASSSRKRPPRSHRAHDAVVPVVLVHDRIRLTSRRNDARRVADLHVQIRAQVRDGRVVVPQMCC